MEIIETEGFAVDFPDLASRAENGVAYSSNGTRAYFLKVGPATAKILLQTYHESYRKLRPRHADSIAGDMRAGTFQMDGSPIRLDVNSQLLDGSHRLTAITKSETIQEFLIVDRLPETVYDTVDTNILARTYIDILRRRGYNYATQRSAITRYILKWNNNSSLDSSPPLSISLLDSVHEPNSEKIGWAVHNASSLPKRIRGVPPSLLGLTLYVIGDIDRTSIKTFLLNVASGEGYRGMPSKTLSDRLRSDYDNNIERHPHEQLWLIFKAWKVYHQNTMRADNDQHTMSRNQLAIPSAGVSIRDLQKLLAD